MPVLKLFSLFLNSFFGKDKDLEHKINIAMKVKALCFSFGALLQL